MAEQLDLTSYAHALGPYAASWRFADAELRRAFGVWAISTVWDTYRCDAGSGEVGSAYEAPIDALGVLYTHDPRRGGVLLWLADHGAPAIAVAADVLARMTGSVSRFGGDEQTLLHEARDAIAAQSMRGPVSRWIAEAKVSDADVVAPVVALAGTVDCLRTSDGFVEVLGEDVSLAVPGGVFSRYVPAAPGATWALNLALLTSASPLARVLPLPGLVSRALFRLEAEPDEIATELVGIVTAALTAACEAFEYLYSELARGCAALRHLSRNSRAREAWLLVAALRSVTRVQLARALGLSRAGGDIQAHALKDVGLVTLGPGGRIMWTQAHRSTPRRTAR